MPRHIGIVAVSPEGSSHCYRLIGRRAAEVTPRENRPRVTLHNQPFSSYVEALEQGDWASIASMLVESAHVLHAAGADFLVLPDNVCHHALPLAEGHSPIPWLNMVHLVAEAVEASGTKRVGVIGTKYVTYGATYQTVLGLRGIRLLVPEPEETDRIDRIIFHELVRGHVTAESRRLVLDSVRRLADRGCEALIVGTTEASSLFGAEECPLPVYDPVHLLVDAAIRRALA